MKIFQIQILFVLSALAVPAVATADDMATTEQPREATPVVNLDPEPIDRSNEHRLTSYADVLDSATPAVVGIYTARIVNVSQSARNPMEEFLRRYYGIPAPQQDSGNGEDADEERRVPTGVGSGVIVTSDGYILTNNHVITVEGEAVDEIVVQMVDGREFDAEIVGRDPGTDVAVLKVESAVSLPAITMTDSDNLRVGDVVFAIGNPLEVGLTVTQGIVSATGRTDLGILGMGGYENFIQTDASINMGNSGGALIDADGRLVGINTAIISRTGGNIGLGFAVPVNLARSIMNSLVSYGAVQRGFLGVLPGNLTPELAESFGLDSMEGAIVNQVSEGMPAEKAGIQHGDVILSVNGEKIESAADLRLTISQTPPGTPVDLEIVRNGETIVVPVVLGDLDEGMAALTPASPLDGVEFSSVNPELRERLNIPEEVDGLVVSNVSPRSPYSDALIEGMVILEVNGNPVNSVQEFEAALTRRVNRIYTWDRGVFGYVALRVQD